MKGFITRKTGVGKRIIALGLALLLIIGMIDGNLQLADAAQGVNEAVAQDGVSAALNIAPGGAFANAAPGAYEKSTEATAAEDGLAAYSLELSYALAAEEGVTYRDVQAVLHLPAGSQVEFKDNDLFTKATTAYDAGTGIVTLSGNETAGVAGRVVVDVAISSEYASGTIPMEISAVKDQQQEEEVVSTPVALTQEVAFSTIVLEADMVEDEQEEAENVQVPEVAADESKDTSKENDTEVTPVGAGVGIKAYYEGQDFDDPETAIVRDVQNPLNDAAIINIEARFELEEVNKQIVVALKDGLRLYSAPGFSGTGSDMGTFDANVLPEELKGIITNGTFTRNPAEAGLYPWAGTLVYDVSPSAKGVDMKVLLGGDTSFFAQEVGSNEVNFINPVTVSRKVSGAVDGSTTLPLYQFTGSLKMTQYFRDGASIVTQTSPYYVEEGSQFSTIVTFRLKDSGTTISSYSLPRVDTAVGTFKTPKGVGITGLSLEGLTYSPTAQGANNTSLIMDDLDLVVTDAGDGIHDIYTITLKPGFNRRNCSFKIVGTVPMGAPMGEMVIFKAGDITWTALTPDGTSVRLECDYGTSKSKTALSYCVTPAASNKLDLVALNYPTIVSDQYQSPADTIDLGGFRIINAQSVAVNDKVIKMTFDTEDTGSINVRGVQLFCGTQGVTDVQVTTVSGNPVTIQSISAVSKNSVTVLFSDLAQGDSIKSITYRTTDIPVDAQTQDTDMRSYERANGWAKYYGRLTRELAPGEYFTSRIEVYNDDAKDYNYDTGADNSSKLDNSYDQKITIYSSGAHKVRYHRSAASISGALMGGGAAQNISVTANLYPYRYDLNQQNAYRGLTFYIFQPNDVFMVDKATIKVAWDGKTYTNGAGITVSEPVAADGGMVYTVKAVDVILGGYKSNLTAYPAAKLSFDVQALPTTKAQTVFYKDIVMYDATESVNFAGADSASLQYEAQQYDTRNIAGHGSNYLIGCANIYSTFAVAAQKDLAVTMAAAGSDEVYKAYTSGNDATVINLQQNTDATIKLEMTNNTQAVLEDGFEIMLPIPKAGQTMPAIGQYGAKTFTWTAGIEEPVILGGYAVKYATAYGIDKDSAMWQDWSAVAASPEDIKMIKIISDKNLAVNYLDSITIPIKVSDPDAVTHAGMTNIFAAAVWRKFGATEGVAASQEIALRLQTGSVKGHVYIDKDENGKYDATDIGIGGATVNAYKSGMVHDSTTLLAGPVTTQAGTGAYEFISLDPAQKVDIVFSNPKNPTGTIAADSLHFKTLAVDGDHSNYSLTEVTPSAEGYDAQDAIMVLPKKVTYNTNSASPAVSGVYQFAGGKINDPGVTLTRQGYTMDSWYISTAYSTKWNFSTDTVAGDMTLYAKATQNNYTITYNCGAHGELAGQDGNGDVKIINQHFDDNTPTAPVVTEEAGYTFSGWLPVVADKVTGDATYVAQYTQNEYTVTYNKGAHGTLAGQDASGNIAVSGLHYNDNTPIIPIVVEETGWTFSGWSPTRTDKVNGTVTYVAQYSQNKYTVTYNKGVHGTLAGQDASGNVATANLVYNDNTPTAPTVTEEAGWTFTGWSPTRADKVTATATYVAQYSQNKYTVTYSKGAHGTLAGQDASGNVSTGNLVYNDNTPTAPTVTDEAGWTFSGWSPTRADKVTATVTYVAQYSQNEYTVTFNKGDQGTLAGQDANGNVIINSLHYNDPMPAVPTATANKGYTFAGWYTQASGGTELVFPGLDITGNITLYAQWNKLDYTVKFDLNYAGSTGAPVDQKVKYQDKATKPATDPSRTGYKFEGWYTAATGGSVYDFNNQITEAKILYAQWSKIEYTVKFDLNYTGATGAPADQKVKYQELATKPSAPQREGYTLDGWFTETSGGTEFAFTSTVITGNITVYAHWTPITYTVTFDKNGAPNEANPGSMKVTYPATTVSSLPTAPDFNGLRKFVEWNTKADGTGEKFTASTKVSKDMTIYAVWNPIIVQYTVRYDSNGGETNANPNVQYVTTFDGLKGGSTGVNTVQTLPTNPTRNGYTFQGWNTKADGTGSTFTATTKVTASLTVYATWKKGTSVLPEDRENPEVPSPNKEFMKKPLNTSVAPGDRVDYAFTGFGNNNPGTVDKYMITDYPPKGLNFVSGQLPAFTKGAGVTYRITYFTNSNPTKINVLKDNIPANKAFSFAAPKLASGDYLTAICMDMGSVPAGFGVDDVIIFTFQVDSNPPTTTLTNIASLSYRWQGKTVDFRYGGDPITAVNPSRVVNGKIYGYGNANSKAGNVKTGDTTPILLFGFGAGAAVLLIIFMLFKRRSKIK